MKTTKTKATKRQLIKSIEQNGGIMSCIADDFGLTIRRIQQRVAADADLQEAMRQARDQLIDEAEVKLRSAVKRGSPWAVKLVLCTLGRHRGYSQRIEVQANEGHTSNVVIILPDNGRSEPQQAEPRAFVEA